MFSHLIPQLTRLGIPSPAPFRGLGGETLIQQQAAKSAGSRLGSRLGQVVARHQIFQGEMFGKPWETMGNHGKA